MNRRQFLRNTTVAAATLAVAPTLRAAELVADEPTPIQDGKTYAEGYVFHDRNGSGKRDTGDPGIESVCVSNGVEVVKTDRNGKYRIPIEDGTVLCVIKPAGWKVPIGADNLPAFHYVHRPTGSPTTRYAGVAPTGDLPRSIDFALQPQRESDKFRMVLFGDPQPRNQTEIDYIAHDVVEQVARDVIAVDAKFGLSLGDEMFDNLNLFESLNRVVATAGIPWYSTVGNHDLNYDAPTNELSTETWKRVFGPTHYAFNYGKVHVMVLNDVMYHGVNKGGYHGEFTKVQLDWIKSNLSHVPKDRLLMIAMHIPLVGVDNREEFYRLIEDRPYCFSCSAHTHIQRHHFIGQADGWRGKDRHHHLNHVTVCGSWWEGAPDERGIPHATMADGAPNGYSIVEFDGVKYNVTFRPASRPESEQMAIWIPEELKSAETGATEVIVNVFAGSERSKVQIGVNGADWKEMEQFEGQDPFFLEIKKLEASPKPPIGLKLPGAATTPHLWRAKLPANLPIGTHAISVKTTDMFGQSYVDRRIFRVS